MIEKVQPFDYVVQTYHVCSLHFLPSDIKVSGKRKTITVGKVPTIFSGSSMSNEPDKNANIGTIDIMHPESNDVEVCNFEEVTEITTETMDRQPEQNLVGDTNENSAEILDTNSNTPTWYFSATDYDFSEENSIQIPNLETSSSSE